MKKYIVSITGIIIGISALVLVALGNPANMGFCIACFLRDTAGALKLHNAGVVQYMRPEIIGIVMGAFLISVLKKEFKPRGGSSTFTRFVLGFFVMIGALVFLGCPLRMILRLASGDLNALIGLVGFVAGISIGILFLNKNFSLSRTYKQSKSEGSLGFAVAIVFLLVLTLIPSILVFSEKGPGALRAPIIISLGVGLLVGALSQRSRMCTIGGIRDAIMLRDFHLLKGALAIFLTVLIGSLIMNKFNLGFEGQPIAHNDWFANFISMLLVGWASVLLGGCPLRQLILAGEGNSDSTITIVGLMVGAAFAHNFKLAASPKGASKEGLIAVGLGLVFTLIISIYYSRQNKGI